MQSTPLEWVKSQWKTLQGSLVGYLQQKERGLTLRRKKIYFFLFVFSFGGFFLYCLVSGLAGFGSSGFKVTSIKRPLVKQQMQSLDSIK
ncbi:hypothetical protein EFB08_17225 [Rufibacter latericius]|uniref:Uncharacterized protein n=1 Tax=Rufibacter latericius TaxID=2487040 RepID=A0A3M9MEX7_9BACT|nr:hypothetical protein EFB08_17225 [Rufibacter latericius]